MPTRIAPRMVRPVGRVRIREVPQAQASQATGPESQPQSSKKEWGRSRARITETTATSTTWTRKALAIVRPSNPDPRSSMPNPNLYSTGAG